MNRDENVWFPAKRYGWGWGLPCRWQGWVVMVSYLVLLTGASILMNPVDHPVVFFVSVFVLSVGLVFVCWRKGEKPRWRWGE